MRDDFTYSNVTDDNGGVYTGVVLFDNEDEPRGIWYVWRDSKGLVGVTNAHPEEIFLVKEIRYHVLVMTPSYEFAAITAMLARSAN